MSAPEVSGEQMLHAALYYAPVCPIFPCEPRGKRPLGAIAPHGVKDAAQDLGQIRAWWSAYPQANIGLACGVAFWVLDVDGQEGWQTLAALMMRHGPLPPTIVSCTGGGGWHYYFAMPTGRTIRNRVGKLGPKLDVRGAGGYVVAAPSVHESGRTYVFASGLEPWSAPLAQAPAWLLELLASPPPNPPISFTPRIVTPRVGGAYVAAALRRAVERIASAPEGRRNDTLNVEALSLSRFAATGDLGPAEIALAITAAARAAGLDRQETERTIASAFRAGLAEMGGHGHV